MKHHAIFLLLALCILSQFHERVAADPAAPASLLSNGDFKLDDKSPGWPNDWPHPTGATWEKEGDQPFVRLTSSKAGQMVMLYRRINLPSPRPAALEVRVRVRYADIKPGEKPWYDGRIISHFKDASDKFLKPEPHTPAFRGTSKGWVEQSYVVKVPKRADYFEIMPCLFQPAGGTLDLARCEVFTATADRLPKPPPIIPSSTIVPSDPARLAPAIHVNGNQLQSADGKTVWLQGVCIDSLEWSVGGEHILQSIPVAIEQWKANVIRLPVTDEWWFGRHAGQHDGGLGYRKLVDAALEATATRGAYLALDLHRFGAPMLDHVEFWKDAATRYKDHPAVLFELFNEAHGIPWKTWRDGGPLKPAEINAAGAEESDPADTTPGMQALVDAVRSTGAKNLLIAGGLDWGYDLSGVAAEFPLKDTAAGQGIMYSSHIYPWKKDWQAHTLDAAAKYPIFVGEVGTPPDWKSFEFIPPGGRFEPLGGPRWPTDVLGMIQKNHLNWTGFSFHPKCAPMLIEGWDYTPTPYWGVYVKEALGGRTFEMGGMR